jgi:hypothetical protein
VRIENDKEFALDFFASLGASEDCLKSQALHQWRTGRVQDEQDEASVSRVDPDSVRIKHASRDYEALLCL